jgi:biopolymer transport protein ExbD
MGMNVGSADGDEDSLNSAINTTPLVDIMLVLLIIFLITVPAVTTSVQVKLPKQPNELRLNKPEDVVISVNSKGDYYFYDTKISDQEDLKARIKRKLDEAKSNNQEIPEVHLRGDIGSNYEPFGRVILVLQELGVPKVAFVTDPLK